jgi:hypothetical protein
MRSITWGRLPTRPKHGRLAPCPTILFSSTVLFFFASLGVAEGQGKLSKRYGFDVNLDLYPQKTPQETLLSISKAVANQRVDYMLAHLADPRFVDEAVVKYINTMRQGSEPAKAFAAFDQLVRETSHYFLEDPTILKELRAFAKDGDWEINDSQAVGSLKTIQGRKVFLRKLEDRWFLENRQQ